MKEQLKRICDRRKVRRDGRVFIRRHRVPVAIEKIHLQARSRTKAPAERLEKLRDHFAGMRLA